MSDTLLEVKELHTSFFTDAGEIKAVRGVGFGLDKGRMLGIVGESGCGKSVTALSILRLVPFPGRIVRGEIIFKGRDLLKLTEEEMRKVRGKEITMIFQEPMTSLNPVFTIGSQIAEAVLYHQAIPRSEVKDRVIDALGKVGIPSPEERYNDYPHQLSGGMRQRVMIAMALSCNPDLLIADEPTTALDVTIQAQILDLMKRIVDEFSMSIVLITHDLGIVAETVDDVLVMYAGEVMEYTDVKRLFANPLHPYTIGLLESVPAIDGSKELKGIPGTIPDLTRPLKGCIFKDRCFKRGDACEDMPELREIEKGHWVRCWKA